MDKTNVVSGRMLGVSRMRCCNWRLGLNPYMQARVVWAMDYLISSTPLNFSSAKEPSSPLSPLPPRITCCVPPACPELLALLPTHPCSQCSARRACARHKYVIFLLFLPRHLNSVSGVSYCSLCPRLPPSWHPAAVKQILGCWKWVPLACCWCHECSPWLASMCWEGAGHGILVVTGGHLVIR